MPYGTINVDTITNFNGLSGNGIGPGFKNRIINGDMRIDQRNAGAAVTANGSYAVDRFLVQNVTDGAFSAQQDSSSPDGFVSSLKFTTTTADATLTTTQQASIQQRIEGTNSSDLGFGAANAKTVTVSFWVRSSLTGTFGGSLRNSASNRSYPFTYTISVADTWEYKAVTIAGDTTGTWLTTTGIGLVVTWGLGCGPDRSGTAGAWNSNNNNTATGAVSVIGTLNATFYITGVQLEVAPSATSFDYRPYGTELALCQRYYEKLQSVTGSYIGMGWTPTTVAQAGTTSSFYTKRAAPTMTASAASDFQATTTGGTVTLTSLSFTPGISFSRFDGGVASGLTIGYGSALRCANSTGYIEISAEL